MAERIDRGVGEILAELDRQGIAENTLVVFSSDNGGERWSRTTPLFHHKATLWEGGIRVPCLTSTKRAQLQRGNPLCKPRPTPTAHAVSQSTTISPSPGAGSKRCMN